MLLFKPFILDRFTSWKESYEYFLESASSFVHSFIQNNGDYHESYENSQDQIERSLDDDLGNNTTEQDNITDQSDILILIKFLSLKVIHIRIWMMHLTREIL